MRKESGRFQRFVWRSTNGFRGDRTRVPARKSDQEANIFACNLHAFLALEFFLFFLTLLNMSKLHVSKHWGGFNSHRLHHIFF
jgi:hypothetical protein